MPTKRKDPKPVFVAKNSRNRIKTPSRNVADEEIISRGNHTLRSRPPTEPTACRLPTPASPHFPQFETLKPPFPASLHPISALRRSPFQPPAASIRRRRLSYPRVPIDRDPLREYSPPLFTNFLPSLVRRYELSTIISYWYR